MPSKAVQQLLEQGQRSGLFSAAATQDLIAQLRPDEALTTDEVAAQMIAMKVLTPYQAEQLLAGRGDECVVAGRYQIVEKLGEGGMGAVYKAHDTQLDRDVAVKVLPAQRLNDADAIARFRREARALARLSHPNIIQAYDNGVDKGRHFLVMEYLKGASLAAILREQGAIPPTLAADLIYQAALGLQHAHEKGLVHRDLKPANLLLSRAQPLAVTRPPPGKAWVRPSPEVTTSYVAPAALGKGIVKILDLGLARFLLDQLGDSQLTKEGIGVGTPDYMAPEQFRDARHADARTDLYSLGCTLYQLISGTVPFPGSSLSDKADAHAKKEPIALEERCPEVPAGLAFVVSKMMAKHPAERFQTAAEVAEALAPYVAGASHSMILLRQTMRFHAGQVTIRPPNRRKRLLAWAGAALAAACFLGLFVLAWASIFPPGSHGLQNDSEGQTTGPGSNTPAAAKPQVITIDNGLTVATDGTGQFTTIDEALAKVKPGMTIRVLDEAAYEAHLTLDEPARHAGITLEAPKGATLILGEGFPYALAVLNVPGVRVRGFRFREAPGRQSAVGRFLSVSGPTAGVVLEDLHPQAKQMQTTGIVLRNVRSPAGEAPVVVRNCIISGGADGIRVEGYLSGGDKDGPAGGVLLCDNSISGTTKRGIQLEGRLSRCQITGNRVWNSTRFGIQFEDLAEDSGQILVANNTVFGCSVNLALWDNEPHKKYEPGQVELRNNLLFRAENADLAFLLAKAGLPKGPGDGKMLISSWKFGHNHRDQSGTDGVYCLPLAPGDTRVERIDVISLNPTERGFLRPRPDCRLATGGAGKDEALLPAYVGAVPPQGVEPWGWDKTWKGRAQRMDKQDNKNGK
jgi:serine/threonine-protein kinase